MSSSGHIRKRSGAHYRKLKKYREMYKNFEFNRDAINESVLQNTALPVFRCNATLGNCLRIKTQL